MLCQFHIHFIFYINLRNLMISLGVPLISIQQQRNVDKYKLKAVQLFQKLQSLQAQSQGNKCKKQRSLIEGFGKKEKSVFQSQKSKEGWYVKILEMVKGIENQVNDQQNEGQRYRRSIKSCVQSTQRELNSNFQRLEKEKKKCEAALQSFVEGKVQSFILKNKNIWAEGALINKDSYVQEIGFLRKEYNKFISEFQRQFDKLKRDTHNSLKECLRLVDEETNCEEEGQIMALMKATHMDITNRLKVLKQQRERTEERVLTVLQKVVANIAGRSATL